MGDFISDTGPAIVNKNYYPYMKEESYICKTNSKLIRPLHFIFHIGKCNTLLISGLSKFHFKAAELAKKLNKRVIYLMHGYNKVEHEINEISMSETAIKLENEILKIADKVICVSEKFCDYMKVDRKDISNKFYFVNNGIEKIDIINNKIRKKNKEYIIISVGGGMKRKNNLIVCEAISRIKDIKIKFVVIGNLAKDGERIRRYNFVEYYEKLTHDEVLKKMSESNLYIQNSYFETFGLGVVEAIQAGCAILISKNVGALSIIENINKDEIIYNMKNIDEIKTKIEKAILTRNEKKDYINNWNLCSWEKSAEKLLNLSMENNK